MIDTRDDYKGRIYVASRFLEESQSKHMRTAYGEFIDGKFVEDNTERPEELSFAEAMKKMDVEELKAYALKEFDKEIPHMWTRKVIVGHLKKLHAKRTE